MEELDEVCTICGEPAVDYIESYGFTTFLCKAHATPEQKELIQSFFEYRENNGTMNFPRFSLNMWQISETAQAPVTGKQLADAEKRLFK